MDSILSLVVIVCSLLLHVCHYYTFILIFTLLCFRARAVSGHAAQRDSAPTRNLSFTLEILTIW